MRRLLITIPLAFRLYDRTLDAMMSGAALYVPAAGIWADACVRAWNIAGRL